MVLLDALRCYLYAFYHIYHELVWVTALLYPYILHAEQIVKASDAQLCLLEAFSDLWLLLDTYLL